MNDKTHINVPADGNGTKTAPESAGVPAESQATTAGNSENANLGEDNSRHKPKRNIFKLALHCLTHYVVPFAISVSLIVWLFHKVDFHNMMEVLRHGVDYRYILLMMGITTLSHMIRGYRWGLQLNGVGVYPSTQACFVSIFGTYALNLVFPRLGEAWRCVFVADRAHKPISVVIGTIVGDRASDLLVVVLLIGMLFAVDGHSLMAFITRYSVGKSIVAHFEDPWFWALVICIVLAIWAFFHFFRAYRFMKKIEGFNHRLAAGFDVLFRMKHKWLYTWLTLGIWICYFLETYVCFFAFPFTRDLLVTPHLAYGLLPGLVAFVFGSFSMAIPSNGGLGPWNIAVMFALSLFGINYTDGASFAMLMWSSQSLMLILLGIYTAIYCSCTKGMKTGADAVE